MHQLSWWKDANQPKYRVRPFSLSIPGYFRLKKSHLFFIHFNSTKEKGLKNIWERVSQCITLPQFYSIKETETLDKELDEWIIWTSLCMEEHLSYMSFTMATCQMIKYVLMLVPHSLTNDLWDMIKHNVCIYAWGIRHINRNTWFLWTLDTYICL